jgi:hypothetical protein
MDSRLQLLLTCLILRHYRWHGYLRSPAFLLASYAFCEQVFRDNHARAQHLARQALEWCERVPDPVYAPRAHCIVHAMIQPWVLRRRHALEPMERIARLAREVGDREFAHYARFLNLYFRALAGAPVSEAPRSLRELASSYTTGLLHREANAAANVTHMLAELHSGDIETKLAASDQTFRTHPGDGEPYIRTLWMLVLCVYGRHDLAFAQSEALGDRLVRLTPFVHIADHAFYRGLAGAALAGAEGAWSGRRHRRALERSLRSLRGWARHGPDFAHLMLFLEAERERLRGRVAWARSLYEHAAERAIQQEFAHHGALAHERRARMLLELRRETEACAALREAQALYMEWGALPKAEAITQELHALGTS